MWWIDINQLPFFSTRLDTCFIRFADSVFIYSKYNLPQGVEKELKSGLFRSFTTIGSVDKFSQNKRAKMRKSAVATLKLMSFGPF